MKKPPTHPPPAIQQPLPDEVEGIELLKPVDNDDISPEHTRTSDSGTGGAGGGMNSSADGVAGAQQDAEDD